MSAVANHGKLGSSREDQWDLWVLLKALYQHRFCVGLFAILGLAIGVAYSMFVPSMFDATLVAVPAQSSNNNSAFGSLLGQFGGGLASLAGVELPGQERGQEAVAVVRSNAFATAFVRRENLADMRVGGWLSRALKRTLSEQEAVRRFSKGVLRVEEDKRAGVIRIIIRWSDRDKAALWANLVVKHLNSNLRERALADSKTLIEYLRRELETTTSVEVRGALNTVLASELKSAALAQVREDFAFRVLDPAVPPLQRDAVSPNRPLVFVLSMLLGASLGLLLSIVRRSK